MDKTVSQIARIWERTLQIIENKLEPEVYYEFLEDSYINDIKNNTLIIVVKSILAANLCRTRYYDDISDAVNEVTETNFKLEFYSYDDIKDLNQSVAKEPVENKTFFENSFISPKLTFDNFVVGSFNREASQAAKLIAKNPGTMFNPLFIYSNSGLGKTHLLCAIGNYIKSNGNPNAKIIYITANDFVEEYIKFIRSGTQGDPLRAFFKDVDVLLMDDIQMLADKQKTQEIFFFIYCDLISRGKQIVLTSDKQPSEIAKIEERLITRFYQGLTVKINTLDHDSCVEILKSKIIYNGLDLSYFDNEVIDFLAEKFSKDVRDLEGALNNLTNYCINFKQTNHVTLDVAIEAVAPILGGKDVSTQLSAQKIISIVSDYYNLPSSQLTGKIRTGQVAMARHIAMYLIKTLLDMPLKKIGDAFGGRDHTTVMSGIGKVENELKTDEQLQRVIDELKGKLDK